MPVFKKDRRGHMVNREAFGPDVEDLYFQNDPLKDIDSVPDLHKYVTYPEIQKKFSEMFDLSDDKTRRTILSLDEAGQNSILTNLTSKLYDHIVKKTTSIDYGKIPQTKGDITKLDAYEDLKDVLEILHGILKEYHQDGGPIDVCTTTLTNLETRKDLFERAYRADCELPVMIYENAVLALVSGVSYMIAGCIEFIKAPSDETYTIQLDKIAYAKSKDYLLYHALEKFNKSCANGDLDKAVNDIISRRVRKFTGVAAGIIAGTVIGIVVIMNIVPILRELVYVLYYTRTRISDFFEVQADLLQMNAYNVEANSSINPEERKEIADKQIAIADKFRTIANKVQIDAKQSDVKASRDIEANQRKYKVDDLVNQDIDDNGDEGVSSLF